MSKKLFVVLIALFFFVTASGNIDSIDATSHMYLAKQMALKGRVDFGSNTLAAKMVANQSVKDGNYYIVYNFGYALFFIPGVLISEGIRSLIHAPSSSFPAQPDYILTWYANLFNGVVVTCISLLVYKILKRLNPKIKDNQWWLMILIVFGTNMVIQGHHQFAHPIFSLFALLSFWKIWDYVEKGERQDLVLFSLLLGVTASLYNMTFVLLFVPFTLFFLVKKKGSLNLLPLAMSFVPAVLVQLFWNYIRYGNPFLTGYMELGFKVYELNIVENVKNFIGMTIAPNKGLLFNNPVLVVSYAAAVVEILRKGKYKAYALFFLALSVCYFLNYSLATIWHGESTYGPRYLFVLIPFGIPFVFLAWDRVTKFGKAFIMLLLVLGFWVQIPGLLIPHFTFPHISKPFCIKPDYRYFDPRCSPPVVGWMQILKRESKETPLILRNGPLMTEKYPNPLVPFRTVYPDPLFDNRSSYKTANFKVREDLFNCVYAFSLDLWWLKQKYYKNITL